MRSAVLLTLLSVLAVSLPSAIAAPAHPAAYERGPGPQPECFQYQGKSYYC